MPISSFFGLQTSLRGLIAQQMALDTTGHNIANASTDGYSRQKVNLAASPALQVPTQGSINPTGHLGSGVDVTGYVRVRDKFWTAWSNLEKSPDDTSAKQTVVSAGQALTDSIHSVRSQMVAAQADAQ